ncbi:aminoglycoside phosphotransferase [Fusarium beomiforme]|uniref:Aminoglycoside phosphotransferase n=1 Tax=Fusarium beomiforme TaxID=44412 RepID=A0A9P5DX48_9HYPO|nr:aminoglycoside phosphotransferase [Fusarium beomiforme]
MNPPRRLELEDGSLITYTDAQNLDEDIVTKLGYTEHRKKLYDNLDRQKDTIRSLVRHHLQLPNDAECTVLPQEQWIKGSFNVCIPIRTVSGSTHRNLILRCCLPYKLAEAQYPGTIDEKLRCEVGAYAWMQQYCTDIRIPYLYGFGFTDNRHADEPAIDMLNDDLRERRYTESDREHRNILIQRNVGDEEECREGMAMRTLLRGLSYKYIKKEFRNGPFCLQFTDLHASNIFVDEDWNVTCLLDLEWISALPVEMLAVPYWLTNRKIDEVAKEHFEEFNQVRQQFMRIFEEEEVKADSDTALSRVMQDTWNSKAFWFWHCLESVDAMSWLMRDQICPQFGTSWAPSMSKMLSKFWCEDSQEMVDKKMNELKVYEEELRDALKANRP